MRARSCAVVGVVCHGFLRCEIRRSPGQQAPGGGRQRVALQDIDRLPGSGAVLRRWGSSFEGSRRGQQHTRQPCDLAQCSEVGQVLFLQQSRCAPTASWRVHCASPSRETRGVLPRLPGPSGFFLRTVCARRSSLPLDSLELAMSHDPTRRTRSRGDQGHAASMPGNRMNATMPRCKRLTCCPAGVACLPASWLASS